MAAIASAVLVSACLLYFQYRQRQIPADEVWLSGDAATSRYSVVIVVVALRCRSLPDRLSRGANGTVKQGLRQSRTDKSPVTALRMLHRF